MADNKTIFDIELEAALEASKAKEQTAAPWTAAEQEQAAEVAHVAELADIQRRIAHLREASRPGERLDDKGGLTAAGHIASAITKLERLLGEMRRKR